MRQITREAGVNVAAVNYHFHDKQELYVSVLKRAYQAAATTGGGRSSRPAPERLRTFIRMFLGYLLNPSGPNGRNSHCPRDGPAHARAGPARAESIQPVRRRIGGIVRELLGPAVPESKVGLAA